MTDRGLASQAVIRSGEQSPSEWAEGTEGDPANNAPCVVYLCSDEARDITGHVFGTGGRRISRWSKWGEERVMHNPGPWDDDTLFRIFRDTIGAGLTLPEPPPLVRQPYRRA